MRLEQVIRLSLTVLLFVVSLISNGSIGILLHRFDSLRTIPNYFLLSSCIADVFNQIFNIPGFIAGYIFQDSKYFVGRPLSLVLSFVHVFFTLANLMSLTLMMLDKLCALKLNIAYRVWRTRSTAFKAIAAKWVLSFVISAVLLVFIWDIDLGPDTPTYEYRQAHFSKRGMYIAFIMFPLFIINNTVVAITTCTIIKHENKINAKRMGLDASRLDETRKRNEINAIKTIGITVAIFFVSYLPATVYGILAKNGLVSPTEYSWLGFFTYYSLFVPGLLNPFIYAIRTRRFRKALKYLVNDPFGSSEIS